MIYDAVVLGLGTMGSAAVLELARRKAAVIGFDQLRPPHGIGSHSGQTRVFRAGYAESPKYVPLVQRARGMWESFGRELGMKLLTMSGLLTMGQQTSDALRGIQHCADLGLVEIERLPASEIRYRYPAFRIPDEFIGLLETAAGWLDVDAAISGMQRRATELGAELRLDEAVTGWERRNGSVVVRTRTQEVHARRLVITAGAWTTELLRDLEIPIRIRRKTFLWMDPLVPAEFEEGAIPIFGFPPKAFYGFPNVGGKGVKVAEHWEGEEINRPEHAEAAGERDYAPVLETASRFLPGLGDSSRILRSSTCLYSMTPDEHFILDIHPEQREVVFAAGFSGHGFKFAPVIGEIMADLALDGDTQLPIEFLRLTERKAGWNQPMHAG
jgi:sarcosine oxidase